MSAVIEWFTNGGLTLVLEGLGLVAGLVSLIVGATPTKGDDVKWGKVKNALYRMGILRHTNEPGTLKWPGQGPTGEVVVKTVKSGPPPA